MTETKRSPRTGPAGRRLLRHLLATGLAFVLFAPGLALGSEASVMQQFEIVEDGPAFAGRSFGEIGPYRLIQARAHVTVDPAHPANAAIVDLAAAPRGDDGRVGYTADVTILTPQAPAQARGVLLAEAPNRGMRIMSGIFDSGGDYPEVTPSFPSLTEHDGARTGFLERHGYTLVWVGWQADVAGIGAEFPEVLEDGNPVQGTVWTTRIFDAEGPVYDWKLPYPAAPSSAAALSVRPTQHEPLVGMPEHAWEFPSNDLVRLRRPAGVGPSAIYELTYTATDARVSGLGFASTRDVVRFLVNEAADAQGHANPLAALRNRPCASARSRHCNRNAQRNFELVLGTGGSQSGRYLRDFLWQGFNDAGDGTRVFDGILPFLSGSRTTFTNRRWAEPGRYSRQHEDRTVYGDQFPFGYETVTDPVSGKTDGLLRSCRASMTCPLIFHVDTSSEFWNAGASLVGTDPTGSSDLAFPSEVRAYLVSSGTHQTRLGAPYASQEANPLASGPLLRALLTALEDWAGWDVEPPGSRWPRLDRGELARPERRLEVGFPDLSGVGLNYTGNAYRLSQVDYATTPPTEIPDRAYGVLVPTVDGDGNDIAGVRLPSVAAPLGTYLGWNPRKAGYAEGQIASLAGSFIPFAPDPAARARSGDPRRSISERYASSADYVAAVAAAARELLDERLLLPADAADLEREAERVPFGLPAD